MESQNRASIGGMEVEVENQRSGIMRSSTCDLLLRVLAFALTLVAAILVGVDKQTKIVPIQITPTLPPFNVPVTAKWHYFSAFVYFVVSNIIACTYAAISLLLLFTLRGRNNSLVLVIIILDTLMVALLFSGNGATAAVGLLGYKGNSHVQWKKVCNVFGKFCNQAGISIVVSMLGSIAFVLLVVLSAVGLHNKSK